MAPKHRKRVEPGIRSDQYGYEAYVDVGHKRVASKRFTLTTPLESIRAWREGERARHVRPLPVISPKGIKPSPSGWCYIYFMRCGHHVKIGRAVDVAQRFHALQTASTEPLELLAVVPGHAVFEGAIHIRFARLREQGEWFRLDDDLLLFIEHAKATGNLAAMLWGLEDEAIERRRLLYGRARLDAATVMYPPSRFEG